MVEREQYRATYVIPAINVDKLRQRVEKVNIHAAAIGCQPLVLTVGPESLEPIVGTSLYQPYVEIQIVGQSPQIRGWRWVARLDHRADTGNIVKTLPGEHVPERYWNAKCICEHCGVTRRRNETYIMRNVQTGQYQQVGSSCIKAFLGGADPHHAMKMSDLLTAMKDEVQRTTPSDPRCADVAFATPEDVLTLASVVLRRHGWVPARSTTGEEPTADRVRKLLVARLRGNDERDAIHEPTENDARIAEDTLRYVRAMEHPRNEYEHNIKVALTNKGVPLRDLRLAVSALRFVEQRQRQPVVATPAPTAQEATVPANPYLPQVFAIGNLIRIQARVISNHPYAGQDARGNQITRSRVTLRDNATQRTLVWFASSERTDLVEGATHLFSGKIVRSQVSNYGVEETIITNVFLVRPKMDSAEVQKFTEPRAAASAMTTAKPTGSLSTLTPISF